MQPTERNGLTSVLLEVRTESISAVEEKRHIYSEITNELKSIEAKLSDFGAMPPPIDAERQANLIQITQWLFLSRESDLRSELITVEKRNELLEIISHLRQIPECTYINNEEQLESIVEKMAVELNSAFAQVSIASTEEKLNQFD